MSEEIVVKGKHKKLWLTVIISVVTIAMITVAAIAVRRLTETPEEKTARYLELGERYLGELKYEKAIVAFNNVLELEPKNIDAVCGAAKAYLALEDNESAKRVLEDYISRIGDSKYQKKQEEAYALLAEILYEEKSYGEVVQLIGHAVKRQDSDGDDLPDYYEYLSDLDAKSSDSNGDGRPDRYSVVELMLTDGITQEDNFLYEDPDGDGLNCLDEMTLGTNPFLADTDGDCLTDYEEWNWYGTDPLKPDTDGDGLLDGTEVLADFDPKEKDSDKDGVSDGETSFSRVVPLPSTEVSLDEVYPVAWADGKGEYYGKIDAEAIGENTTLFGIGSKLGDPVVFSLNGKETKDMKLGFCIPADLAYYYNRYENLKIASYDYDKNQLVFHMTEVIRQSDGSMLVLANATADGTYLLINYNRFKNDISITDGSYMVSAGKADIVFVLDITGSMGWAIDNVKENLVEFTEYIRDLGVDIRFGLVYYKDIYEDGPESTQDMGFYYSYDEFLDVLSDVEYLVDGGGDNPETVVDALYTMKNMEFRAGVSKFAIVITDASYKDGIRSDRYYTLEQITEDLQRQNIYTSVVTDGDYYYDYKLLTEGTDGELCDLDGSFIRELTPLMDKIGTTVQEGCWIRLSNGCVVHLKEEPVPGSRVDSDGDGITDVDELGKAVIVEYEEETGQKMSYSAYTFHSNPALQDSDGDGYSDLVDKNPIKNDVVKNSVSGSDYKDMVYLLEDIKGWYEPKNDDECVAALDGTKQLKKMLQKVRTKLKQTEYSYIPGSHVVQSLFYMLDGEDELTPYYMPLELFGKEEVAKQIALTLSYNLPVYAQSGIAGGIDVYEDEEGKEHLGKISGGAWFTILGYQRDDVRGATTIRLLYEGNECYADLSQLFENDFMGAVVGLR